ncbi:MAG: sigma-70 family RNA polymerase sigma factor [Bacteroidales bacterium]|nr:sigma-70 family RNA polymerase sigma factor [Bacteroidales bacterium]
MSENELIGRVIDGDESAFRRLVEDYQDMVIRTCNGFVHDREDAHDLAQDVFVEVLESIHKFRRESKLSTWLYRVAVNKSLNFVSRQKRKQWISNLENALGGKGYDIIDKSGDSDKEMINNERSRILRQAIESLPQNQKIAFTLNKYEELSYKEIAEVMNVSLSSVESLIHRAKMGLQKKLVHYYKK